MKLIRWLGFIRCQLGDHGGHWEYTIPGGCSQVRVCTRCSTRFEKADGHIPSGDWVYVNGDSCDMGEVCERCYLAVNVRKLKTVRSWIGRASDYEECNRCGATSDMRYFGR